MPRKTNTPLTDAKTMTWWDPGTTKRRKVVDAAFARKLERELAKIRGDGWIPLKEKLPELEEEVLLFGKPTGVTSGKRQWRQGWKPDYFELGDAVYDLDDFTHWRPLPEHPKEKSR